MGGLIHEELVLDDGRGAESAFMLNEEVAVPTYYTIDVDTVSAVSQVGGGADGVVLMRNVQHGSGSGSGGGGGGGGGGFNKSGDGTETSGASPAAATSPSHLDSLVPRCMDDAGTFLAMCGTYCSLFWLLPLCALLPLYVASTHGGGGGKNGGPALLGVLVTLLTLGVILLLYFLRKTICYGMVKRPPAPPIGGPLYATTKSFGSTTATVLEASSTTVRAVSSQPQSAVTTPADLFAPPTTHPQEILPAGDLTLTSATLGRPLIGTSNAGGTTSTTSSSSDGGGAIRAPYMGANHSQCVVTVRHATIIVNPAGGGRPGGALAILAAVQCVLEDEFDVQVTVIRTRYAGHTRELAATMDLAGMDALCVIGGDGSIHEVINGLHDRGHLAREALFARGDFALGIIPGGSGNSLCHDMGSLDPCEVARRIGRGEACWMDVNHVEHGAARPVLSINTVAWGLVGDVGVMAEDWRVLGPSRYDACALWGVAKGAYAMLNVEADGESLASGKCVTAFANHTQYFGSGLRAAPAARLDDGLLDVVLVQSATRDEVLKLFQLLPDGRHAADPQVVIRQARRVTLSPRANQGVLNIDGEIYRRKGKVTISVLPRAVRVFLPSNAVSCGPGLQDPVRLAKRNHHNGRQR